MRVIFAGTPDFAAKHLEALAASEHDVVAVYTQPDRPAGRGRKLTPSPVKMLAQEHHLPVYQPKSLRHPEAQSELAGIDADIMIVVAYGLILPKVILDTPHLGCLNVHGSLLPKWRGAAPIQQAVLAGDAKTGVTIMQMDEGLDTGDMLLKSECFIDSTDTSASLYDKLAELGPAALLDTLTLLEKNELKPEKQNDAESTYAHKLTKAQANIDWTESATIIDQAIRGYNPWPVAYSHYQGQTIRLWQATPMNEKTSNDPGEIVAIHKEGLDVATGEGVLRIQTLQLPGKKAMPIADILNGHQIPFSVGERFMHE